MFAMAKLMRGSILTGLTILAGTAAFAPAVALAQDYRISVQAAPQVLYEGQRTRVKVFIAPSDPIASHAIASAAFDVLASDPQWAFVTDGEIVGSDVLGIDVSLPHPTYPSNPYPVWSGIFRPQSNEPALVEIEVDPTMCSVHPSELASSSAECEAEGGSEFIFVNPLKVGRWLAAPGPGTEIEVQDDVIVDGRIITAENYDSASVGIVPTGTVSFFDSSTRVEFDGEPVTFTATVQWVSPQRSRVTSLTVTFDRLETGGHTVLANDSSADGVGFFAFEGFRGGVRVASGDLDDGGANTVPALVVDALPQTIAAGSGTGTVILSGANTYTGLTMVYDQPIAATVRDRNGLPRVVTLDRIEVHDAHWRESVFGNELNQPSLGCHVFEAVGVKQMRILPSQGD